MESKTKGIVILYHLIYVLLLEMILNCYVFELSWCCFKTMLLLLLLNLSCNNFVETPMYENYLWTYCNMWLVVLNHVRSWFVCWFVWDPSWFHRTTGFIWAQVWLFDHFGYCYCTCALINQTVLLQYVSVIAGCLWVVGWHCSPLMVRWHCAFVQTFWFTK